MLLVFGQREGALAHRGRGDAAGGDERPVHAVQLFEGAIVRVVRRCDLLGADEDYIRNPHPLRPLDGLDGRPEAGLAEMGLVVGAGRSSPDPQPVPYRFGRQVGIAPRQKRDGRGRDDCELHEWLSSHGGDSPWDGVQGTAMSRGCTGLVYGKSLSETTSKGPADGGSPMLSSATASVWE